MIKNKDVDAYYAILRLSFDLKTESAVTKALKSAAGGIRNDIELRRISMRAGNEVTFASARSQGRPPNGSRLQIAERLLETTSLLLESHSHFDLTE